MIYNDRIDSHRSIYRKNIFRLAERCCIAIGLLCLAAYAYAQVDANLGRWANIQQLEAPAAPNQSLWNAKRVTDYQASLSADVGDPLGVLRISAVDLTVPIFDGTSELALNRGAGRIEGTAPIGAFGNAGIAGHRDGFFRALKDIKVGDVINVDTPSKSFHYRVTDITIVEQADLHVLQDSFDPTLTLVTCYPFYFVGHAPQRYIVKGVLDDTAPITQT